MTKYKQLEEDHLYRVIQPKLSRFYKNSHINTLSDRIWNVLNVILFRYYERNTIDQVQQFYENI